MPRAGSHILTAISLAALIATATLTLAAPPAQAPILPTPTLFPVEAMPYTLDLIEDTSVQHFSDHGPEWMSGEVPFGMILLGDLTITSLYPRGIEFALQPLTCMWCEIESVTLTIQYPTGGHERVEPVWNEDRNAWIAHIWPTGMGIPAWTPFKHWFHIRDTVGAEKDTFALTTTYVDSTRQWWRAESDDAIFYWFGFGDDDPDQVAARVLTAIAATEPRRRAGFGQRLSYKPVNVLYSSPDTLSEIYASGITDRGAAERFGVTVLAAPQADLDAVIGWLEFVVPHEMTHLYQFDTLGSATGPMWWAEGQANWFTTEPGEYDARLRKLGALQDLPALTGPITLDLPQSDGRPDLGYDMGASFINWLLTQYGGIETHAQIVALMRDGADLTTAIESVTSAPFFDVENAWRDYLGVPPFTLADRDPASALEPLSDPVAAIGATMTLPAAPPMVLLYEEPVPNALVGGSCWANTAITILRAGSRDEVDYYEVDCLGQIGWLTGNDLTRTP